MENVLFHLASEFRHGPTIIAAIMPVGGGQHAVMIVGREDHAIMRGALYRSLKAAREAAVIATQP
jgi:hypothetical protein